jgi:hypothetical protein
MPRTASRSDLERYQIRRADEQTDCDFCGEPLDLGDHATLDHSNDSVTCCNAHALALRDRRRLSTLRT